jgi:hypothetical protein
MPFRRMIVMDANSSLRTVRHKARVDSRELEDPEYLLPESYVNKFADEVLQRQSLDEKVAPSRNGDPCDGAEEVTSGNPCTERWRAANETSNKKSWALYRETGIFACACRHGFLLWLCDLVDSGEL